MHLSNYFANSRVKLFLSFLRTFHRKPPTVLHLYPSIVVSNASFVSFRKQEINYDIVSRNVKNEFDSVIPTVSIWRRILGYRSTTEYSVSNFHGNNEVYVRQRFPSTRKKLFRFERCNNRADLNEELEYL